MINKTSIRVKIKTFKANGRHEITTKKELEKYPIGSLISYLNHNDVLYIAGFITRFEPNYFVYMKSDFGEKRWRGRYDSIKTMWVGDVYATHNDIVSINTPREKGDDRYSVSVDGIVVYYGKQKFDMQRFEETDKHRRMIQWLEYFGGKNN